MAAVSKLGLYGASTANIGGGAVIVSAAITGTAVSGLTESQVRVGGKTIIVTLTNDTWVASGATFNAQRQNIIDGLDSAQSETTGWNAEVRDKEVVTSVVRTSDTVVTITLSAAAAYDVTANETITVTVPGTALSGGSPVTGSSTFGITADPAVEEETGGGGGKRKKRRNKVKKWSEAAIEQAKIYGIEQIEQAEEELQAALKKVAKPRSSRKDEEAVIAAIEKLVNGRILPAIESAEEEEEEEAMAMML